MQLSRRAATGLILAGLASPAVGAPSSSGVKVPTRGFALPDWLSASPRVPASAFLEALRSAGFETIRLPVDPTYVSPDSLTDVARVLRTLTELGFNAILDLHPQGKIEPAQISLAWERLAPVLAETSPDQVYAELLNEPQMDAARWRSLRDRLAAGIRKRAPRHPLIWGPARYQGIWELDATGPLADDNSIVAIHYYAPMAFTHQCENWDDSPVARIHNLPFPANRRDPEVAALAASLDAADLAFLESELQQPWTIARIDRDFGDLAAWADRHHTAAMRGEFGVLNVCVDPVSRARWVRSVRLAAETNGIGWTYWEVDQGFGFVADRSSANGVDADIVAALI
jgi:endoglucanase